jgi:hypothetical protein
MSSTFNDYSSDDIMINCGGNNDNIIIMIMRIIINLL